MSCFWLGGQGRQWVVGCLLCFSTVMWSRNFYVNSPWTGCYRQLVLYLGLCFPLNSLSSACKCVVQCPFLNAKNAIGLKAMTGFRFGLYFGSLSISCTCKVMTCSTCSLFAHLSCFHSQHCLRRSSLSPGVKTFVTSKQSHFFFLLTSAPFPRV